MADKNTIARPYAQALFELAQASGELSEWSGTLDMARQLLADGQVVEYLSNPALTEAAITARALATLCLPGTLSRTLPNHSAL